MTQSEIHAFGVYMVLVVALCVVCILALEGVGRVIISSIMGASSFVLGLLIGRGVSLLDKKKPKKKRGRG